MIPQQIFEVTDIPVIGMLILLEGLLSADNALVLAIMVRHLPEKLRGKALIYGLGGAFIFRAIAILLATFIMGLWWLQAIGALYLVWITVKHFFFNRDHHEEKQIGHIGDKASFWKTVLLVELADIAFAVDSVLAAVALVQVGEGQKFESKLWVIYAGAIIGVILLRYAAKVFLGLLEKYPFLEHMAFLLVGWAGVKLAVMSAHHYTKIAKPGFYIPEMPPALFWSVLFLILIGGGIHAYRNQVTPNDGIPESIEEEIKAVDNLGRVDS
jgi:YkoY family integral membrane protein